jgi:N-formylglutamate amidohydrolase
MSQHYSDPSREHTLVMETTRRHLMAERDKALAAGDLARFQDLTRRIAALPMRGVRPLTTKDIQRYNARKDRA